jgi:prolipoprotein diacylglyceryltransferase
MIVIPTAPWAHITFDVLAWLSGMALGMVLYRRYFRDDVERIAAQLATGYFVALAIGALAGAWLSGSLNTLREAMPKLSHSVAGALAGGIVGVEIHKRMRGIRGSTGGMFVGSLCLGIVVGRFGCLFAGLPDRTYGTPTTSPWGVDLGDGVSRHPVQIYESLAMAAFLGVYLLGLRGRRVWASRYGFYLMCAWYGLQRFAWEFLKPYPKLIGPLNIFHIIAAGLVIYGRTFTYLGYRDRLRTAECALPVPGADHQPL